jgi:hypothetical protein
MDRIRISLLSECYAHDGNNLINIMTMKSGPRERLEPQKMGFQQIDDNLKFTLSPTITLRAWQLAWRHIYIYIHNEGACPPQFSHLFALCIRSRGSVCGFDRFI